MALEAMEGYDFSSWWWHKAQNLTTDGIAAAQFRRATGRFGGYSKRHENSRAYHKYTFTADQTVIFGFAVWLENDRDGSGTGQEQILAQCYRNTTLQFSLRLIRGGGLQIWQTAGEVDRFTGGALKIGTWNYVELRAVCRESPNGEIQVWINGVQKIDRTGIDFNAHASLDGVDTVYIGGSQTLQSNWDPWRIDDLYIMTGAGTKLGDPLVETIRPSGAGTNADWTGIGGGSNYLEVDETDQIDQDGTFNYSATVTDQDTFAQQNLSTTAGTVHAVKPWIWARDRNALDATRTIALRIRSGTAEASGNDENLDPYYKHYWHIWETDPDTATAWTVAGVNAMEAGYILTA